MERISDTELAELCDRNGFPSVGDELAAGKTQEAATDYMVGRSFDEEYGYPYEDAEGHWLREYVEWLHRS